MGEINQIDFLTELNIQDIVAYIAEDSGIEYDVAIDRFYCSETFLKLTDRETGLYRESAAYIYELYKAEIANGKLTQIDNCSSAP